MGLETIPQLDIRVHRNFALAEYKSRLERAGYEVSASGVSLAGKLLSLDPAAPEFDQAGTDLLREKVTELYLNEIDSAREASAGTQLTIHRLKEDPQQWKPLFPMRLSGQMLIHTAISNKMIPDIDYELLPSYVETHEDRQAFNYNTFDRDMFNRIIDWTIDHIDEVAAKDYNGAGYFNDTFELETNNEQPANIESIINKASIEASVEIIMQWMALPGETLVEVSVLQDEFCRARVCGMHCVGNKLWLPIANATDREEMRRLEQILKEKGKQAKVSAREQGTGIPYSIQIPIALFRSFSFGDF